VPTKFSESDLARVLPGSWVIAATNFPLWLSGKRLNPTLSYETLVESPLVLKDTVAYTTDEGVEKTILGKDSYNGRGFTWRGRGLLGLVPIHWAVTGVDSTGTVVTIQYDRSLVSPAGIDILTPVGVEVPEVRSIIATDAAAFGLSLEGFASLTWLGATPPV